MAFGKLGRPAEDRLLRQREIYCAVSPLLLNVGVQYLSMQMAARAACLSIGGLYHYFPTKRDLVLHGIQPDVISRYCQDFHDEYRCLVIADPAAFLDAYVGFLTRAIDFVRPALNAALDLRLETLDATLAPTLAAANLEFAELFPSVFPAASDDDIQQAGRAINRTIVAALFDRSITAPEFHREVSALFNAYLSTPQLAVR